MRKLLTRFKNFFLDHVNWCHKQFSNGEYKPSTWFYEAYARIFYPIPWQEEPCWCCASARGLIYGITIGSTLAGLILLILTKFGVLYVVR